MKKKKSKLQEYSKKAIAAMIVLWFVVAIFGMIVTVYKLKHTAYPENVSLDALFNYVGVPMVGGIVTYLLKSAVENKQKIKKSSAEEFIAYTKENTNTVEKG